MIRFCSNQLFISHVFTRLLAEKFLFAAAARTNDNLVLDCVPFFCVRHSLDRITDGLSPDLFCLKTTKNIVFHLNVFGSILCQFTFHFNFMILNNNFSLQKKNNDDQSMVCGMDHEIVFVLSRSNFYEYTYTYNHHSFVLYIIQIIYNLRI